jgi:SAM-dependent methyltransferase
MYDSFSQDYDRFVNWAGRLDFEMPFIEAQIQALPFKPERLLDAACGTGMHVIELARRGYQAAGADLSPRMAARAVENASSAGVEAIFKVAGFGQLAQCFSDYDALLCLGNSLPHVSSAAELEGALVDFAACLHPGGLLLLQNRNFDAVLSTRQRWMEPQSHGEREAEWLFLRFYDFDADGLITFHVITLHRAAGDSWQQKIDSTRLYPLRHDELLASLQKAGFGDLVCFGSMDGSPFEVEKSGNLIIAARLR